MKHRVAGADITVSKLPARADVSQELLGNLLEKYADLKHQGKTDEEAYQAAVASFGDLSEIMEHVPHTKVGNQCRSTGSL